VPSHFETQHKSTRHKSEAAVMRKEALRVLCALLPPLLWVAAPPRVGAG
jgi:hypothetical protein